MKTGTKYIIAVLLGCFFFSGGTYAQTTGTKTKSKTSKTTKKPAPPLSRKDVSISLLNSDEHSVPIFAGPKEELKQPKPKMKIAGGLSQNTLYVKENDIVCILDANNKPLACADVKPGVKSVQINSSGNGITAK